MIKNEISRTGFFIGFNGLLNSTGDLYQKRDKFKHSCKLAKSKWQLARIIEELLKISDICKNDFE
jgi:hypothetical protein